MKIGQLEAKAITPAVSERRAQGSASSASSVEASAKVELSTAAQLSGSGSEGVFDAEKVKEISAAIRDGKFEINAEAIADKLIANAQEMLGKFGKA